MRRVQNFKAPAVEAAYLAGKTEDLSKADDAYSGKLTTDAAKELLTFGGRGGGGGGNNAPEVTGAEGQIKFFIKDGVLSKYEVQLKGAVNFNGENRDLTRTMTVEVSNIGSTKVVVPDEAKQKTT